MSSLLIKTLLLLGVWLSPAGIVRAQPIRAEQVPPLAFVALQQHYPQARQVKWKKAQGLYQASYTQEQAHGLVRFNANGDVEATGADLAPAALPAPVRHTLTKYFPSRKICQAAKIVNTHTGAVTYEAATCESNFSRTIILRPDGRKVRQERWD